MRTQNALPLLSLLALAQSFPFTSLSIRQSQTLGPPQTTLKDIQTFNGTLGCNPVPVMFDAALDVRVGNRPFIVNGSTYDQVHSAMQNSCSKQMNCCADAVNDGAFEGGVSDCNAQQAACDAVGSGISSKAEFKAPRQKREDDDDDDEEDGAAKAS